MTLVFIIFVIFTAMLLLPSLVLSQKKSINDVNQSLLVRMQELKREYKLRKRQLAKRLKSDDLAQEEWQQLSDELTADTAASIESTQYSSANNKSSVSVVFALIVMLIMAATAFSGYKFSSAYDPAEQYMQINKQLLTDSETINKLSQAAAETKTQESITALYMGLRSQVELFPDDDASWRALALFNSLYARDEEALEAIKNAAKIDPDNIDIHIERARIALSSKDKNEQFRIIEILENALQQHPDNRGAKLLLGSNAFSLGLYQLAINSWQEVVDSLDASSPEAQAMQQSIDEAKNRISASEAGENESGTSETRVNESDLNEGIQQAQIVVKLLISDAVKANLTGDETVFVFAKAISGPELPLAVMKFELDSIPDAIKLSDANAMQAAFKLSNFSDVQVTARISKSGNAIAQAGDLEIKSEILNAPFNNMQVTLTVVD